MFKRFNNLKEQQATQPQDDMNKLLTKAEAIQIYG